MNCKDLNIENCFACEYSLMNSKFSTKCWIEWFDEELEKIATTKFLVKKCLIFYIKNDYSMSHLQALIEFKYPEYVDMLDKIRILI